MTGNNVPYGIRALRNAENNTHPKPPLLVAISVLSILWCSNGVRGARCFGTIYGDIRSSQSKRVIFLASSGNMDFGFYRITLSHMPEQIAIAWGRLGWRLGQAFCCRVSQPR